MNKKLLGTVSYENFVDNYQIPDRSNYKVRTAAWAIVADEAGRIALLYVSNFLFNKLPGGGVEEGEDIPTALIKELKEEIGCEVEIGEKIGEALVYWDKSQDAQTSHCYFARIKGVRGSTDFTDKEKEEGYTPIWCGSLDTAIAILESDIPDEEGGIIIRLRDLLLLKEARKMKSL